MLNIVSSSRYKVSKKYLRGIILKWLDEQRIPADRVINIIFVGKNKMRTIASKYKNENEALPVLSFNYEDKLGEVFICYPQAVLLAAERDKRVNDMLVRLIKHGVGNLIK